MGTLGKMAGGDIHLGKQYQNQFLNKSFRLIKHNYQNPVRPSEEKNKILNFGTIF